MRDIRFRGKNAATGSWVYGFIVPYADSISGWAIVGDHFLEKDRDVVYALEFAEVLHDTVGQYTGRADVRDNPVFEGDIINVPGSKNDVGVVRFGDHPPHVSYLEGTGTGFYIDWQGEHHGMLRSDIGYWIDHADSVVIGNIYDNPERLEVKM